MTAVVSLDPLASRTPAQQDLLDRLAEEAGTVEYGDLGTALDLASQWAGAIPAPGEGETRVLWECLATLGAMDLQVARAFEPHLDAVAIHREVGQSVADATTWGVFAAEGKGHRLEARRESAGTGWRLHGSKPWCSLAAQLSHALVTAWVDDEQRGLFAVHLREPGVVVEPPQWSARGLRDIVSSPVTFEDVAAVPVGEPGWYLSRDGFAWGGMGVAAVWYGGAVAVARRMRSGALERQPDQVGLLHLGRVEAALVAARSVLVQAARAVDAGLTSGTEGAAWALRTRQVVADAAETVLRQADHALGPGPLVSEPEHAARVADLHLYLRQHHGERDTAALGHQVLASPTW